MKTALRVAATMALFAAVAVAQIPIPPHASVYNGYSRGYTFTAGLAFIIAQLQLPPEAMQAGDTGSFLVRVNGTTALRTVGVAGSSITPNLAINQGDVVDIIGNWSPAVPGSFTAHNWYGNTAPFASSILGVPHTLQRSGWQWDIGDPAWTSGVYLAPTTGQIGRVFLHAAPLTGYATATAYGTGCYHRFASYYEHFGTAAAFDLSNSGITMIRNGGGGYTVIPGFTTFVPPAASATVLALADDAEVAVNLAAPFPYDGGTTSALTVCSNGFVSVAAGNGVAGAPAAGAMLAAPRTAWWNWHNYNPAAAGSGTVKFHQQGTVAYVTWDGVWDQLGTSAANANRFQFQFDTSTGFVHLVFQTMSAIGGTGFLVGYSPGGASLDPGNRDLSVSVPATFVTIPPGSEGPGLALGASARPVLGTNFNLNSNNIPAGTSVGATVLGFGQHNPGLALAGLGMPGCQQYVSLECVFVFVVTGTTGTTPITMPGNAAFSGMHFFAQSATFSQGVNVLGVLASNGVDLLAGTQ